MVCSGPTLSVVKCCDVECPLELTHRAAAVVWNVHSLDKEISEVGSQRVIHSSLASFPQYSSSSGELHNGNRRGARQRLSQGGLTFDQ